jgi:uncharacterized protein YecE (DUF72 family)
VRVMAGTSGYAYQEWKGPFYPEKLPQDQMLRYYGERFPTVEINNTFYRMPSEKVLLNWADQVPETFAFVLKASQRITHQKRLQEVGEELGYFLRTASVLGSRLGPTLFQLPPNLRKDLPRLNAFLDLLPHRWRAAMEFRHASWRDDEVYDALRRRGVAWCVADTEDDAAPVVATADWGYLRLRREGYAPDDLARWAGSVLAQPWQDAFVFFKHEDAGAGPALARAFLQAVSARSGDPPAP